MPWMNEPEFKHNELKLWEVSSPGSGGINLKDVEYEQDTNQSPRMLNMMYRNGSFSKRYGQEELYDLTDTIYNMAYYRQKLIVHAGSGIYDAEDLDNPIATGIPETKGMFIQFSGLLYYMLPPLNGSHGNYYQYDGTTFSEVVPYIPDLLINRKPDGTYSDAVDAYNFIGNAWTVSFHGDGSSTVYILPSKNMDATDPVIMMPQIDANNPIPKNHATYGWTYNRGDANTEGRVTFNTAPPEGVNNVRITGYKTETVYYEQIYRNKYYAIFGGDNNSRLFLGGGGNGMIYYSATFDNTYFPENNTAVLGNSEYDITGFGKQYNILVAFKEHEMYSLSYYVQSQSTTTDESEVGKGAFTTQVINSKIGCDCPGTIQLIDNRLTWLSSTDGVCTLASTNILDERDVIRISRNIDRTNNLDVIGILDWDNIKDTVSIDYDDKYFLINPHTGYAWVWDYGLSPYYNSGKHDQDAKRLSWFLFDNIYATNLLNVERACYFALTNTIRKLNDGFMDVTEAIHSYYQTPLYQFNAVEYLKNVQNIYVECRSDTASVINMWYVTDEETRVGDSTMGNYESEPIEIGNTLWISFLWEKFTWGVSRLGKVFRRKCKMNKVQMFGVHFENDEMGRDMSISHIGIEYALTRTIR